MGTWAVHLSHFPDLSVFGTDAAGLTCRLSAKKDVAAATPSDEPRLTAASKMGSQFPVLEGTQNTGSRGFLNGRLLKVCCRLPSRCAARIIKNIRMCTLWRVGSHRVVMSGPTII
eukprot:NODE_1846_length_1282_cov_22.017843_g1528_i0.p2 GENE.NODE_1846_length_1282_cov_22.017843_g1528_i0~~NODE_1846_length_1282_cov_22.017843_g1528_i0.p2  ORF type:complete len:115 (+),score=1.98 NODE_1846_length_1282_cov_22.017843_g1528_i0:75-419(+)